MDTGRKAKLKISPCAATYLKEETPRNDKIKAAMAEVHLKPADLVTLLIYLSRGQDAELRSISLATLKRLDVGLLTAVCTAPDTHPLILNILARLHWRNEALSEQIAIHGNTDENTLEFLAGHEREKTLEKQSIDENGQADSLPSESRQDSPVKSEEDGEDDKDEEEYRSKFQMAQVLGVKDKIKLALTGDKEWRMLLIKDNNKLVSEAVIKNPRITEQEVLLICKSTVKNDEIIRNICTNKDWTKNNQIRKALIENPKTPLHYSLSFLSYLGEKDLSFLAKSKNISSVIATQARRMLFNKKTGK